MAQPTADQLNRRVLLVDDNDSIHADFRKILGSRPRAGALDDLESAIFGSAPGTQPRVDIDYTIESAFQGEEAAALAVKAIEAGKPYALAFVDMRMPPGWDGLQTVTELWKLDPDLQVVICTAYSDYSWQQIIEKFGRSDRYLILKKPFDTDEVRQLALMLTTKWNLGKQAAFRAEEQQSLVDKRTSELREQAGTLRQQAEELQKQIAERAKAEEALRLTQFAIDHAADAVFWTDKAGRFHYVNEAACHDLGYSSEELLGMSILDIAPDHDMDWWQTHLAEALEHGLVYVETVHRHKDGSEFPVEITLNHMTYNGQDYLCAFARDITDRKFAEQELRESEERYALAAQGANDGLWDWNVRTGTIYFSRRWKQMLGYREIEIGNRPESWFDRVHPADMQLLQRSLEAHLEGKTAHFENEHRLLHKDGSYRWMLSRAVAVRDDTGQVARIAGSMTDITSRKAIEEQLRHDANHDRLTGLANRVLFTDRLGLCLDRARRNPDYEFAVLFLDLDHFKVINDSLGHIAGDELLTTMARRLSTCLRTHDTLARFDTEDTVARMGGDEFTVLLDDINDISDAIRVADRICDALSAPVELGDQEVTTTSSIGIASSRGHYISPQEILRDADTAMYHAKGKGRGRFQVFDTDMHQLAVNRLQVEQDLRKAIERGELRCAFQPIVSMKTGELFALEALVRWEHPERGLLLPAEFIALSEETGLIVPLGEFVLEEACRQTVAYNRQRPEDSPLAISVNISQKQLSHPGFVDQVASTIERTGLDPKLLLLEITESVMMRVDSEMDVLRELKRLELKLLLDDFGTGYSSLCYLPTFPTDGIKIGPPFVTNLGEMLDYAAILKAINNMAHDLGLSVIAEGIETIEQLAQLQAFGCDCVQGNYFSKPLLRPDLDEFIVAQQVFEVG